RFTAVAATRMRRAPGTSSGAGASPTRSTLSSPYRSVKTAFTAAEPNRDGPRAPWLGRVATVWRTLPLTEFVFVVPLGGLVVLVFLYLRRLADGPAATAWGGAWLAVYGAGLISTLDQPPAEVRALGTVLGSLFPGLLLAGSLGVHRGRFAAWPIGFALAIGLTRLALLSAGRPDLAIAVEIPCELPLTLAAAALAWRNAFASRSLPEQLLGPTL